MEYREKSYKEKLENAAVFASKLKNPNLITC